MHALVNEQIDMRIQELKDALKVVPSQSPAKKIAPPEQSATPRTKTTASDRLPLNLKKAQSAMPAKREELRDKKTTLP